MRLIFATALLLLPTQIWADEISTNSQVVGAKVFPSSATITRSAKVTLPVGDHQIIVTDMPAYFEANTLQVGTSQPNGFLLRSKRVIASSVPPLPVKTPQMLQAEADLVDAEAALNRLEQQRAGFEAVIASAGLRIRFLESVASGQGLDSDAGDGLTVEKLVGLAAELGEQISAASQQAKAATAALAASDRDLADAVEIVEIAEMALRLATPETRDTGALVLEVAAAAPFDGEVFLSYVSRDASWRPDYEVNLDQAGNKGTLKLVRQASVRQGTGEDWKNVDVTLSTADLFGRSDVIIPRSTVYWLVDKEQQRTLSKVQSESLMMAPSAEPMMEVADAGVATSQVVLAGQTLEFGLGNLATLRGNGEPVSVRLDVIDRNVPLYARANARIDTTALLYTDLTNETGGTLLAGPATIYRDGVLTASAHLPQTANGEVIELPLGKLNGIVLEHRTKKIEAGDSGFVKSKETRKQSFEVLIDSFLDYDIDLTVYAALPVSEDEDLTVRLDSNPQPVDSAVEGRRGVAAWTLPMAAGAKETISYGWELRWPDDQQLLQR